MPADFLKCMKTPGHKIRTESGPSKEHGLASGEYVRYCIIGKKSFRGEVHKKKDIEARARKKLK